MKTVKVLWLSNVPPLALSEHSESSSGGWLAGALQSIRENISVEVVLSFPIMEKKIAEEGVVNGIPYFGFYIAGYPKYSRLRSIHRKILYRKINQIIETVNPDFLHVFGTEFPHSQIAIESFNKPDVSLLHIQGLVSRCAEQGATGIPFWARNLIVPSTLVHFTPRGQLKAWKRAGKDEIKAITQVNNIAGRTEWDEACTMQINPKARYFHYGETLRQIFYTSSSQWELKKCTKHSIYFSQGFDQIKGIHTVLPILPELIKRFPKTHLYVGGPSPIQARFLKRRSYGFYISSLIKKYNLFNYVTFLGPQSATQVIDNLTKTHVLLSASLLENSPNAVGEALIVGVPTVSSDVGGVKNFIEHGRNGFVYPVDEPYMIPYYIGKIFERDDIAHKFSREGKIVASEAYDPKKNGEALVAIYKELNKKIE